MNDKLICLVPVGTEQKHGATYYNFIIRRIANPADVGVCNLRYGNDDYIAYSGNIGYKIDESYRGNQYAVRATLLLADYAESLGIDSLLICCAPENAASRRVCEAVGAEYLGVAEIPESHPLYAYGTQKCCRYLLKTKK